MSAMARFTMRSLAANRVRTLVTVAGVALAAALLTAVLTSYTSLQDFLYRDEVQRNGLWTASVRLDDGPDGALAAAGADDVHAMAALSDVGFAANDEQARSRHGRYLPVLALEGDAEQACAIVASEGRLPAASTEVMLPESYRSLLASRIVDPAAGVGVEGGDDGDGPGTTVSLGDAIALDVGQREAVAGSGPEVEAFISAGDALLDSDAALLDAEPGSGDGLGEHLVDVQQRRYTVVGFYDRENLATVNSFGPVALTGPDPDAAGSTELYLVMDGAASTMALEERVRELFPGEEPYLHGALLRAMGIRSDAGIWDTLYGMVGVLAAVIVVACAALIYNAFAISVAERVRQFGLLASIGASRRQLRQGVLLEALLVAVVGVPLGVALGIGGTGVVLALLGPSLSSLLGGGPDFALHVEPGAVAVAAALALASVLVSGWIPARRASRSSAVDALRCAPESRMPRSAARAAQGKAMRSPWARRGLGGRALGVGRQLAAINAKRGAARGRTASLSLALAMVLLMTAGSLTTYLTVIVDATGAQIAAYDVEVNAFGEAGWDEGSFAAYQAAYDRLAAVEGVEPRGYGIVGSVALTIPEGMAGAALKGGEEPIGGQTGPGTYGTMGMLMGLSDDAFRAYAESNGVEPGQFFDPDAPRAIAIGTVLGNDGLTYLCLDAFARAGTLRAVTGAAYQGRQVEGLGGWVVIDEDGSREYRLRGMATNDPTGEGVPLDELDLTLVPIEALAVAAEGPPLRPGAYEPMLVMPASMMGDWGLMAPIVADPSFRAAFDADDHEGAAMALKEAADGLKGTLGSEESGFVYVQDIQAQMDNMQALVLVVDVFCLLFTVMLMLVALANVFNTVANGLILRRREFAVMRSAGMGARTFRCMIAAECARYSLRGLLPGLAVAVLVSYGLYRAMALSVSGLAFALPWGHMALSVALVAVALALSVAYGLHRCRSSNVVEALRDIA